MDRIAANEVAIVSTNLAMIGRLRDRLHPAGISTRVVSVLEWCSRPAYSSCFVVFPEEVGVQATASAIACVGGRGARFVLVTTDPEAWGSFASSAHVLEHQTLRETGELDRLIGLLLSELRAH